MRFVFIFVAVLFCCYPAYSQGTPEAGASVNMPVSEIKTADVNADGNADVTYYRDGRYVSKIEADTNYDGRADVVVYTKDGKFDHAEADTDHDGKMDKKFSDVAEFNKWLNSDNPDFQDRLSQPDWQFDFLKF